MCCMVWELIWFISSFISQKLKKLKREGKCAIWPNWFCQQSITVLSTPPSSMKLMHNFWLTNFSLIFVADFQVNPTDISCKKYWKNSQSKNIQHCSYLQCPLVIFIHTRYLIAKKASKSHFEPIYFTLLVWFTYIL